MIGGLRCANPPYGLRTTKGSRDRDPAFDNRPTRSGISDPESSSGYQAPAQRVCRMEREMIKSGLLSAALVAAAMFATPAMARSSHGATRHLAADAYAGFGASHADGAVGIRVPRIGAHAAPAAAGRTCDVGDNERIC